MGRCYFLPVGQIGAQLAAGSLNVFIGRLVADEALVAEQLCAVLARSHSRAYRGRRPHSRRSRTEPPSCRSERAFEAREHRLELALLRLLSAHCGSGPKATTSYRPALLRPSRRRGRWWQQRHCTLRDAVCHGLGVAGGAPEYDCYFAPNIQNHFRFIGLAASNILLHENASEAGSDASLS